MPPRLNDHVRVRIDRGHTLKQWREPDRKYSRSASHVEQVPGAVQTQLAHEHVPQLGRVGGPPDQVV
jgi:hypothetical protein